ncbi:hypothetical protein [Eoetvoesiella caeni]|uniref:Uncharacterized protein n=1 Tax=Eoetvoesiella caeni TaxID=645616 RepID=A0A366H0N8_9BURK|nr:hypothetical protein [Eoetvoesiella caeni]MCI2810955.1 hypothetical protein [Eoetvoesiella caeni]NYT56854.1 hypothetical protein [Eoetvoesiella caeni]RBP35418.1 hypothetical protein DFR37_11722 [Eoetvoesiella caeni]
MIFSVSAVVGIVALLLSLFLPKDRVKADALEDDDDDILARSTRFQNNNDTAVVVAMPMMHG